MNGLMFYCRGKQDDKTKDQSWKEKYVNEIAIEACKTSS